MVKAASGGTYTKLVDIKEFPDLGGDPEMLETTTLSDKMQTYIAGIQSMDGLSFTANYTLTDYKALKAKEGTEADYAVWFGGTETGGSVSMRRYMYVSRYNPHADIPPAHRHGEHHGAVLGRSTGRTG